MRFVIPGGTIERPSCVGEVQKFYSVFQPGSPCYDTKPEANPRLISKIRIIIEYSS